MIINEYEIIQIVIKIDDFNKFHSSTLCKFMNNT